MRWISEKAQFCNAGCSYKVCQIAQMHPVKRIKICKFSTVLYLTFFKIWDFNAGTHLLVYQSCISRELVIPVDLFFDQNKNWLEITKLKSETVHERESGQIAISVLWFQVEAYWHFVIVSHWLIEKKNWRKRSSEGPSFH